MNVTTCFVGFLPCTSCTRVGSVPKRPFVFSIAETSVRGTENDTACAADSKQICVWKTKSVPCTGSLTFVSNAHERRRLSFEENGTSKRRILAENHAAGLTELAAQDGNGGLGGMPVVRTGFPQGRSRAVWAVRSVKWLSGQGVRASHDQGSGSSCSSLSRCRWSY
jgi:hypothetical protein